MTILHLSAIVSICVGVVLSTVQILLLVWREFEKGAGHRTLSIIGAKNPMVLRQFRRILIVCGGLITFGFLFGIAPYTHEQLGFSLLWIGVFIAEIVAALVPVKEGIGEKIHTISGGLMAAGFLATAILFVRILPLAAATDEYVICLMMGVLAILGAVHYSKFIFYELPFIFLSHVSIVIAVIALR